MTDRELLEAAAKAAGLTVGDWIPGVGMMRYEGNHGNYSKHRWNPLIDDGDALRLAVALGITIDWTEYGVWVYRDGRQGIQESGDPYAATRRAIVRAAAAMEKA